jgi:hypothetical protein
MPEMNPYKEGYDAFKAGKKRNDNPHHMASSAHDAWHDGYDDAEQEAAESNTN